MDINWIKCQGDVWGKLNTVNLDHAHFDTMAGVYVIWHGGSNSATVYVGQGVIKDRLAAHRKDPRIQQYAHLGLYVTWASVQDDMRDGVEAYLSRILRPKESERSPDVAEIQVNLPWG